jgi:hypothetical protein
MYAGLSTFVSAPVVADAWSGLSYRVVALTTFFGLLLGLRLGVTSLCKHQGAARALQATFGAYSAAGALLCAHLLLSGARIDPVSPNSVGERVVLAVILTAFMANAAAPYFGWKTEFSLTMFSNMRPDRWTHILAKQQPPRFASLAYITVESIEASPPLDEQIKTLRDGLPVRSLTNIQHWKFSPYYFHEALCLLCRSVTPAPAIRVIYTESGVRREVSDYAAEIMPNLPRGIQIVSEPYRLPANETRGHCA